MSNTNRNIYSAAGVIGSRIREARRRAGLDQATLGKLVGRSQGAISSYERGYRQPSWGDLRALGESLGQSVSFLVGEAAAHNWSADQPRASGDPSVVERLSRIEAGLALLREELAQATATGGERNSAGSSRSTPDPVRDPATAIAWPFRATMMPLEETQPPFEADVVAIHHEHIVHRRDQHEVSEPVISFGCIIVAPSLVETVRALMGSDVSPGSVEVRAA